MSSIYVVLWDEKGERKGMRKRNEGTRKRRGTKK
jgi:hypothetical protein